VDGRRGDELLYVQGEWSSAEREMHLICDLELAASTFGLVALASETTRTFVYSFTDNVVAMAAMRKAAPRTETMQALCAERGRRGSSTTRRRRGGRANHVQGKPVG
jgi:hypothetical protein